MFADVIVLAKLDQSHGRTCGLAGSPADCFTIRRATPAVSGTSTTIEQMYRNAAAAAGSPAIVSAIESIWTPGDAVTRLRGIFRFLVGRIRYMSDKDSLAAGGLAGLADDPELLIAPDDLLSMRSPAGDCDEFATAALAMILGSGLPVTAQLRTIAADPRLPGDWSHVYVVVRTANGDIPLDASHGTDLGWEAKPGAITRRGGRVVYVGKKKDWGNASMDVSPSHVAGLRSTLGQIAGWSDTLQEIVPSASRVGLRILERRYGNPPTGTYRSEVRPDGSSVQEAFGNNAFPNNVSGFGSGALLAGVIGVGGLFLLLSRNNQNNGGGRR